MKKEVNDINEMIEKLENKFRLGILGHSQVSALE